MKATLEFNLPDDNHDFELASRAVKWYSAMWELDQFLRSKVKYDESLSDDAHEAFQEARDKLYEILNDNSISFD